MQRQKNNEEKGVNKLEPSKKKFQIPKFNRWQVAFFTLLALIFGFILLVGSRVFDSREDPADLVKTEIPQGESLLTINTNKSQVNTLIDHYLADFQENSEIKYDFYLDKEALLTGEFELFNFPVQFYLYFDPYVMEDGNVQLRATSLSLGILSLPISDLMAMVARSFDFPEWVEFDSGNQMIILKLNEFDLAGDMHFRAERINLIDDEIRFSLYLPEDSEETD